jgi:hypothetical protein
MIKFEKTPADFALCDAIKTYIESGGTIERAIMFVRATAAELSGGHSSPSHTAGLANRASRHASAEAPTRRNTLASINVAKRAATTIMDSLLIDGRAVGDFNISEARKFGREKTRDGYILLAASRLVANATGVELLRDVVKDSEMQRIRQKAEEVLDNV